MIRTFLTLGSFLFALPLASGDLSPMDVAAFWRRSGIDRPFVQQHFGDQACLANPQMRAACAEVVREGKEDPGLHGVNWSGDFDAILDQIDALDQSPSGQIGKGWLFANLLNAEMRAFDAHAALFPIEVAHNIAGLGLSPHYGIGVHTWSMEEGVFVGSVATGSPAERAGVLRGDQIVAVNDQILNPRYSSTQLTELLTTPKPQAVRLNIRRGDQLQTLTVNEALIHEPAIRSEPLLISSSNYLHLIVAKFSPGMCEEFRKRLESSIHSLQGIILDLRDNPGGDLKEAVCLTSLFVGGHVKVVSEKPVPIQVPWGVSADAQMEPEAQAQSWYTQAQAPFAQLPVVVLINARSASASELVAGALQDLQRAWIVGTRSFGKGSIQVVRTMKDDRRFAMAYTVGLFQRPNGDSNQLTGVTPNFLVSDWPDGDPHNLMQPLREVDTFPSALKPAENPRPFFESRPEKRTAIKNCMSEAQVLNATTRAVESSANWHDHQQAAALAVLLCDQIFVAK